MNSTTIYLSKHLTLQQATICRPGFLNHPTDDQIKALTYWGVNIYDPICEHFGFNIFTHSIFRDNDYNRAIGGDPKSDHRCIAQDGIHTPAAGDLDGDGTKVSNKEIFDFAASNLKYKQIIWEKGDKNNPDWVHIAAAVSNNQMRLTRCLVESGKTKYIDFDLYKVTQKV